MRTLNTLLLGFALALSSAAYSTENDAVTQEWMHLIKADFPKGCVTQLTPIYRPPGRTACAPVHGWCKPARAVTNTVQATVQRPRVQMEN